MKGTTSKAKETISSKIVIRAMEAAVNAMVLIVDTTIAIKATAAISEAVRVAAITKVISSSNKDHINDQRGPATLEMLVVMAISTTVVATTAADHLVTKLVEAREEVLLEAELEETEHTRIETPLTPRTIRETIQLDKMKA